MQREAPGSVAAAPAACVDRRETSGAARASQGVQGPCRSQPWASAAFQVMCMLLRCFVRTQGDLAAQISLDALHPMHSTGDSADQLCS